MEFNLKEFGKRVFRCRKDADISQKQLASMIHISNNHLSNIENGKSAPSFFTFLSICAALGVSPSYLIDGTVYALDEEIIEKIKRKSDDDRIIISKIIDAFPERP